MTLHVRLLTILLLLDLLLIGTSGLLRVAVIGGQISETPDILNIGRDWSAGEMLNYAKWSLMAVVFGLTWRATGLRLYLALAVFMLLVLADDALQLHERGSDLLMTALPTLRSDNGSVTEIVIWAMIGLLGLTAVVLSLGSVPPSERAKVQMVGLLFVPIIFFGVVVDAVHAMARDHGQILMLVEDGGEMLAISVLAAYVYATFRPWTSGEFGRFLETRGSSAT